MKLEILNEDIAGAIELLTELKLSGSRSRLRTRITLELEKKLKQVQEEYLYLIREHTELEKGEEENLTEEKIKDVDKFLFDKDELFKEVHVIEDVNLNEALESVKQSLEESDVEWKGRLSYIYYILCESITETKGDGDNE